MNKIFLILTLTVSINSWALDHLSVLVGARNNHSVVTGASSNDKLQIQAGILTEFSLMSEIVLRTGAIIAMKDGEVQTGTIKVLAKRLFLDVPLTLVKDLQTWKVYGGVNLAVKLSSDSCLISSPGLSCAPTDERSFQIVPLIGTDYKINSSYALGAFYEWESEYQKNWKQSTLGINFEFKF